MGCEVEQIILEGKEGKPDSGIVSISNFLNRFTLIIGEVNRGKTTLTQKIFDAYHRQEGGRVAVVDLAPTIVASDLKGKTIGIGGRLIVYGSLRVRYFHGRIHAPRLKAKVEREALDLAAENAQCVESIFERALDERIDALFVNDCSLYLHAGNAERLLGWIRSAVMAVVNGYYGESLGSGLISAHEREGMEHLINHCDRVIRL